MDDCSPARIRMDHATGANASGPGERNPILSGYIERCLEAVVWEAKKKERSNAMLILKIAINKKYYSGQLKYED